MQVMSEVFTKVHFSYILSKFVSEMHKMITSILALFVLRKDVTGINKCYVDRN
jgi:hypothetical protein